MPQFEFSLTQPLLDSRLADYHLGKGEISQGKFTLQRDVLQTLSPMLHTSKEGASLLELLLQWPTALDADQFRLHINSFLQAWVSVYRNGIGVQVAATISTAIIFKYRILQSKSEQFQLFLQALLFEATHSVDQDRLNLIQNHDARSGLPNIQLMYKQVQAARDRGCAKLGLLVISFRLTASITSGYRTADPELMVEVIKLIRQNLPEDYLLYQFDLAEFGIFIMDAGSEVQLDLLAAKVQRAFELTLHINKTACALTPTIAGVYQNGLDYTPKNLYAQARRTLDDAIASGRHFILYNPEIDQRALADAQLRQEVINAFENDRFELYLQPIVDLTEKVCSSAEVLLRCHAHSGDFISPQVVIDTLYKQGFGGMFLRWLINTVCRLGSELKKSVGHPIRLSINLAAEDLIDTELPYLLAQSLELWDMQADLLTLEITENGLLLDEDLANITIQHLVDMGCCVALDDFGTGYSSMTRLRTTPIHFLKLDQSFVRKITTSNEDFEIIRAIVMLAHALGKQVVAEGVEDQATLRMLQQMNCQKIQGYFFLHPVTYEEFIGWTHTFHPCRQ